MNGTSHTPGTVPPDVQHPQDIAIAGSFTLDLFQERMAERSLSAPLAGRISYAPYGQLSRFLLSSPPVGTAVLLARWEDWFRHGDGGGEHGVRAAVREFAEHLRSFCRRGAGRVLLIVCPAPPEMSGSAREAETVRAEEELARCLPSLPSVTALWAGGWVAETDPDRIHDPYLDKLAHLPYSEEFFSLLADRVTRWLTAPPARADRTLVGVPDAEWASWPPDTLAGPDPTFRRLVDRAGDLWADAPGTGILAVSWRPWLPRDPGPGPVWVRGARALDAYVSEVATAVWTFRQHHDRPLLLTVPPGERSASPLTNLFRHCEESLVALVAETPGVTLVNACSARRDAESGEGAGGSPGHSGNTASISVVSRQKG